MQQQRKNFFYLFGGVFLLLCPLLLLHVFGFFTHFNSDSSQRASIVVATHPAGATAYLGGSRFTQITPLAFDNLLPGIYSLHFTLPGYDPLDYGVKIFRQQTVNLKKILFLPTQVTASNLIPRSYEQLIDLDAGGVFILREGQDIEDYAFYNWQTDELIPFTGSDALPWGSDVLRLYRIKASPGVVLECDALGEKKFVYLEPEGRGIKARDVSQLISETPEYLEWDPADSTQFFVFLRDHVDRVDATAGKTYEEHYKEARGMGVYERHVFIVTDILNLKHYDYDKNDVTVLLNDPLLGNFLFGDSTYTQVRPLNREVILFIGDKGQLLLNKVPHRFVEEGVRGFTFHQETQRLLFWKDDAIGIIDVSGGSGGVEETLKVVWVFQGGEAIGQAFWVYDGSHVLFRDGSKVMLLELTRHSLRKLRPLVQVLEDSSVYYSEENGSLYYLNRINRQLLKMQIVPLRSPAGAIPAEKDIE